MGNKLYSSKPTTLGFHLTSKIPNFANVCTACFACLKYWNLPVIQCYLALLEGPPAIQASEAKTEKEWTSGPPHFSCWKTCHIVEICLVKKYIEKRIQ